MQHDSPDFDLLLDQIREAARKGDFAELERLNLTLEDALLGHPPDEATLHEIRAKAEETTALLQASISGVLAAKQRLDDIRTIRSGGGTYDGDGRRQTLAQLARDSRRF